jgi:hypothetical protein
MSPVGSFDWAFGRYTIQEQTKQEFLRGFGIK